MNIAEMEVLKTPGERLNYYIYNNYKNQKEFAEVVGVTPPTLNLYVKNQIEIGKKFKEKLDKIRVPTEWILTGKIAEISDEKSNQNLEILNYINIAPNKLLLRYYPTPVNCGESAEIGIIPPTWIEIESSEIKMPERTFVVRASGHSMSRIGIVPGTLLVCESLEDIDVEKLQNKVVIAQNGGTMCKRLIHENGKWLLRSDSYLEEFQDIELTDEITLQAIVIDFQPDKKLL